MAARLLARQLDGEFAVADAAGETFGIFSGGFFAISGNELGESGKKAALRQAVAVDAIETSLSPSFLQISECEFFLLVIRGQILISLSG
jgi:hypothetical protein